MSDAEENGPDFRLRKDSYSALNSKTHDDRHLAIEKRILLLTLRQILCHKQKMILHQLDEDLNNRILPELRIRLLRKRVELIQKVLHNLYA